MSETKIINPPPRPSNDQDYIRGYIPTAAPPPKAPAPCPPPKKD